MGEFLYHSLLWSLKSKTWTEWKEPSRDPDSSSFQLSKAATPQWAQFQQGQRRPDEMQKPSLHFNIRQTDRQTGHVLQGRDMLNYPKLVRVRIYRAIQKVLYYSKSLPKQPSDLGSLKSCIQCCSSRLQRSAGGCSPGSELLRGFHSPFNSLQPQEDWEFKTDTRYRTRTCKKWELAFRHGFLPLGSAVPEGQYLSRCLRSSAVDLHIFGTCLLRTDKCCWYDSQNKQTNKNKTTMLDGVPLTWNPAPGRSPWVWGR